VKWADWHGTLDPMAKMQNFDIHKSTIEIIEEYCDSDDDLKKIVDTENTENDNLGWC
jgi:hypothetical protein